MTKSTLPVYPANALDEGNQLTAVLGAYWANSFGDRNIVNALQSDRLMLFKQADNDLTETTNVIARATCPVYHREIWLPVYLRKSTLSDKSLAPLNYGPDKALYGIPGLPPYDRVFTYGSSLVSGSYSVFPLPSAARYIRVLANRIADPTVFWIEGVDFRIDHAEQLMTFPIDVFSDPRIARRDVLDADGNPDVEALLWAYAVDIDQASMWKHFGFVVNIQAESNTRYRDYINAVLDMHIGASSVDGLTRMLLAAFDIPVALEDETVQTILYGRECQIITDKNTYVVDASSTLLVAVGDVLHKDDLLVDTVENIPLVGVDDQCKVSSLVTGSTALQTPATMTNILPTSLTRIDVANDNATYVIAPVDNPRHLFHGLYTNEVFSFDLNTLPTHAFLDISFDLLVIGDWTGNDGGATWSFKVDGQTITSTNFSNKAASTQAYPDEVGVGAHARYTGAVEPTTAHPIWSWYVSERPTPTSDPDQPSRYHFSFKLAHARPSATISFEVTGLPTGKVYAINPFITKADQTSSTMPVVGPTLQKYTIPPYGTPSALWTYAYEMIAYSISQPINPDNIPLPFWTPGDVTVPQIGEYWPAGLDLDTSYKNRVWSLGRTPDGGPSFADTLWGQAKAQSNGFTYPEACWGIQFLTVNALAATRTQLSNISGDMTDVDTLTGISLDSKFLAGTYFSSIFFPNKDVPVTYVPADSKGFVDAQFELTGFPADVTQFWTDVHARGVAQGWTFANYLDQRKQPYGQPRETDLPKTVNPMKFIIRHFLKSNLLMFRVKRGLEGKNALAPIVLDALYWTLPPHMAYIIITEVVVDDQEIPGPILTTGSAGSGPDVAETLNALITERAPIIQSVEGVLL